jgi:hypothetical protein
MIGLALTLSVAVTAAPALTPAEIDAFRQAVAACWRDDAALVPMTVGLDLDRDGRVVGDPRMVSAPGIDPELSDAAFNAAVRAIRRCKGAGYDLPAQKYALWQSVEIVFDPQRGPLR